MLCAAVSICEAKSVPSSFKSCNGFAHQSHSLAHRVMNFTETLGRLFLSGNLGHHVRRSVCMMARVSMWPTLSSDLVRCACVRQASPCVRPRTILVVFGDLRAQAANLVAAEFLQSPHFAGEVRAARKKQTGSESQKSFWSTINMMMDKSDGACEPIERKITIVRGKKPQPSRHQRLQKRLPSTTRTMMPR